MFQKQTYKFRLHEHPDYGWQPRLSARNFISLLTNLTAIKIRGTYSPSGVGFLDDVELQTASRGVAGPPALWIESCDCPTGKDTQEYFQRWLFFSYFATTR